jgi:zinc protease
MHRRFSTRLLLVLAVAVSALTTSSAQNRPAAGTANDIPMLPVESYKLPNGLQVMLSENHRLPMVAVNLWYHVGPANELPGRTGFAHLFEHMMFQCSKHVPCDSHLKLLEQAGAADLNGTTDFDRTNYFETVPSNQLELALWLESDRMGYLLDKVDQAALANQQDVVRNERRQSVENQPYGLADEALVQLAYPKGHPYYGSVIGSHADIQAAKLEDVKNFFKQYYAPNNASIVIAGDFDKAQTKQLLEKYFGTLKNGPPVPPIQAETPKITAERRKVVPVRAELPRLSMAWITSPIFKPGDADADMAAQILGGGRSSRLYKKLVYEKQIAQNVAAYQQSLILGSLFQIEVTARPGHTVEELEKAVDEEVAAMRTSPPAAEEIERARNSNTIETNIIGGLERLGGFGGIADRLNSYNHYLGRPDYLQQDVERYRAVTAQSIQAFARDQLPNTARVVVHAVPGEPQIDPGPPAQTAAPAAGTPVAGSAGAAARQAAGAAAASGGAESINADEPWRNQMPKPAAAKTVELPVPVAATLPNGLTLMLNRRAELPMVSANIVFRTGSDANPADKPGLANFVAAMLDEGTATRNALQIADEVARLGGTLGTGSTMDSTTVSGRSLAKNFPALLDLMADVTLRPAFPAEEVERQRAQRLGQLVALRDNPTQVATQVMSRVLYGDRHPYGYTEIGTEASIKGMKREDMQAFWKQNFVPNNAALVVAGDISMDELRALAEKAFGGWQRGAPVRPALSVAANPTPKVVIVDKPGSPQTQVRVATIGAQRSSPDFRPMQVMNMILGGQFSSRINMNLREANGYTYGTYSGFTFRRAPGPFQVAGGVRTDVTGPAVDEIYKEIRGMLQKPFDGEELTRAKDSMNNSLPGAFQTSSDAVASLSNIYTYDLGLDYYAKYAQQVRAVSVEQAIGMVKKYLPPDRLVVVAVGDKAKIESDLKKLNLGPIEYRDAEGKVIQ